MKGKTRLEELYLALPRKKRVCAPGGVPLEGTAVALSERVGMSLFYARKCLADLVSAGLARYDVGVPEDVNGKRPKKGHGTRSFWRAEE